MLEDVIEPLGFTSDNNFIYFVAEMKSIVELPANQHHQHRFISFATQAAWRRALDLHGGKTIDWQEVAERLMERCRERGVFDPTTGRGRGLWKDEHGKIVFNTGKELHVFDGHERSIVSLGHGLGGRYRYLARPLAAIAPADAPATAEECRALLAAFARFSWQNGERDAVLVLGWMGCAMLINLVSFRPQLAITAEKGSGKSAVVDRIVRVFGNDRNCLHFEADSATEAGIRQILRNEAMPVILDEFETDRDNISGIIRLLRVTSNPNAGAIVKGQVDGTPQRYVINTCACGAGITVQFRDPADASRFLVIELVKTPHTESDRRALADAFKPFDEQFGAKMLCRLIMRRDAFEHNLSTFRMVIRDRGGDDRYADLLGHVLAGYWTLCHDEEVTTEEAASFVTVRAVTDDASDEHDCLNHLLGFRIASLNATVGELLSIVVAPTERSLTTLQADGTERHTGADECARVLEQHGIRYDERAERIVIANKVPGIGCIFARTRWRDGGHAKRFKRLGGDDWGNKTVAFAGARSKATSLPVSLVLPDDEP